LKIYVGNCRQKIGLRINRGEEGVGKERKKKA
jgi:hypothetical protein